MAQRVQSTCAVQRMASVVGFHSYGLGTYSTRVLRTQQASYANASHTRTEATTLPAQGFWVWGQDLGFTWTPEVCRIMAFWAVFKGLGLLLYILLGVWGLGFRV